MKLPGYRVQLALCKSYEYRQSLIEISLLIVVSCSVCVEKTVRVCDPVSGNWSARRTYGGGDFVDKISVLTHERRLILSLKTTRDFS